MSRRWGSGLAPLESFLGSAANPIDAEDKTFAKGRVPPSRQIRRIAPGYFKTMGTRVVAGRDFSWADLCTTAVASPSCRRISRASGGVIRCCAGQADSRSRRCRSWREIVGVVENVYDDGVHVKPPEFAGRR